MVLLTIQINSPLVQDRRQSMCVQQPTSPEKGARPLISDPMVVV